LEDIDGMDRITIVCKEDGRAWTGLIWLRIGTSKHSNKLVVTVKCGEFYD
jgi:hypothetical protein